MSRPKTAKKGDREAAPAVEAGQVQVKFTLDFTATATPFIAPPSNAYDTRFTFTLLTANPTTSPPTSTWSPATAPTATTAVRWTTDVELLVSKETVFSMETDMLKVTIEQREVWVAADTPPSSDEMLSPSKVVKAVKAPVTNKKPKVDKPVGSEEGDRKSTAHPALTDELPFTPAASFLLPLSTLLAPPHSLSFSSAARTDFVLPAGLSSMSCSVHTNGTNPMHPSLLPTLLPLALSLTSLSSLPVPPAPSPYRPLSLSFALPSHPQTFAAPALLPLTTPDLTLHPTLYPTRVVLLGRLSRSALYEASTTDSCGIRVEVRDREHKSIKTKEEAQEEERIKQQEVERREAEEREKQKEEEKKKKSAKLTPAIKSPKAAANKQQVKAEQEVATAPGPVVGSEVVVVEGGEAAGGGVGVPAVVLDCRSNVYGVAVLSLVELFQSAMADSATVDVVSGVTAVLPPADVPLLAPDRRTNPYVGTLLTARLRLLHPLPPISQLVAEAKYARAVAVWPEDNEVSWLRVHSEVLRMNAKAVRVDDGESEGQGSWQWLEAIKADEQPQPALEPAVEQKDEEVKADNKEKDKAKATKAKKELKPTDAATPSSTSASPLPPAPRTLQPLVRPLSADHITGCMVLDGRSRWLFVEGLADGEAWKAIEAALTAERKTMPTSNQPSAPVRVLLDNSVRFAGRSFSGCALTLSTVQLTSAVSSLQVKAATASTCVLTLSSLSSLLAPQLLPDLKAACRANGWLNAASVQELKERVGREPKLEEVYGKERAKHEKEIRKRRAKEAKGKEERERLEAEKLELEKQQHCQQDSITTPNPSSQPTTQPPTEQKPAATTPDTSTAHTPATGAAVAEIQPADDTQVADVMSATQSTETAEATLPAGTIERKRTRTVLAPQSAPASLPTYTYSNAAEYQAALRSLRAACHADKNHHYTFHLDYLHSSVPVCESVEEADKEERRRQRRKWRTDRGFVMPPSRVGGLFSHFGLLSEGEREKERKERRRTRTLNELVDTAWQQKQLEYNQRREVRFYTQPLFPSLFDRAPQRSVHLSGEEQVRAEREVRERERSEWEAKMCVDDTAFHVLWGSGQNKVVNDDTEGDEQRQALSGSCRLFGLRGLRKDEPIKQSLQFKGQQDGHGNRKPKQKQLVVDDLPVSITNVGEWRDPSQLQFRESGEKGDEQVEFIRYFFPHPLIHKRHIQP